MCVTETLTTVADEKGEIHVKSAKSILKELNTALVALRRINFLAKTFNEDNIHLREIAMISGEVVNKGKNNDI